MQELLGRGVEARRAGNLDQALTLLTEALQAAGENRLLQAKVLRELGELARNQPLRADAIQYYLQAVALLREAGAGSSLLADTVRHLGDVYTEAAQHEAAGECLREAVALYADYPGAPALDVANAQRSLAIHCELTGATAQAQELWCGVRTQYARLGITAGVDECTRRLQRLDALR